MTPELQQLIIDRLFANLAQGLPDLAADAQSISTESHTSPERFDQEQRHVFRHVPIIIGTADAVAIPGDFFTANDYHVPILVTRADDGTLHAFLNACTHRGARLVGEAGGHGQRVFACPYHGWVFGNDGQLRHITQAEGFPNTAKADRGLVSLPVAERFGLIWTILQPGAELDLDTYLAGLAPELAGWGFDGYAAYRPHDWTCRANWKTLVEGGLETYHFRNAHDATFNAIQAGEATVIDRFGPHARMVVPLRTLAVLAGAERRRWRLRPHASTTYFLFPNTFWSVQQDHGVLLQVFPEAAGASRARLSLLIPSGTAHMSSHWDVFRDWNVAVLGEDFALGEQVGDTLRAGGLDRLTFGRNEQLLSTFHQTLTEMVGAP